MFGFKYKKSFHLVAEPDRGHSGSRHGSNQDPGVAAVAATTTAASQGGSEFSQREAAAETQEASRTSKRKVRTAVSKGRRQSGCGQGRPPQGRIRKFPRGQWSSGVGDWTSWMSEEMRETGQNVVGGVWLGRRIEEVREGWRRDEADTLMENELREAVKIDAEQAETRRKN